MLVVMSDGGDSDKGGKGASTATTAESRGG